LFSASEKTVVIYIASKFAIVTLSDPAAIIYQLEPGSGKSNASVLLLKADDNVLFILDKDTHFLVGNEYCSYTLNRKVK